MLEFIRFGVIDNGILIFLGLCGITLAQPIEKGLNWLLKTTPFKIGIRSPASFGVFCGGVGNAISDFAGGIGVSWDCSLGTFLGCMAVIAIAIPFVFKIDKNVKKEEDKKK